MKHLTVLITALVLFLSTNITVAQNAPLLWNGTSEELENFVKSADESKTVFALQKIIMNPQLVNASAVAYDVYRMYRYHNNDRIRQMALVALYKMEYYYLLKNLRDDLFRENNPEIRKQIQYILNEMPVLTELD